MGIHFKIIKKLEHFTVDIEAGFESGILVIQGESGAGKTTVLNCISGIMTPEKGSISIGESLVFEEDKVNLPARERNIGYLFQNYALFPHMSVKNNVLYGLKNKPEYKDPEKRKELLDYGSYIMEAFKISHLKKRSPMSISGGEKQRVALARAVALKPGLLLLDEPFSALDSETKEPIYEEFHAYIEQFKIPAILITHDPEEGRRLGDKKIFMREGKITEQICNCQ